LQTNNFRVDSVRLYGDVIGNLRINGDLDSEKSGLSVNAFLENHGFKYIDIRGFVPMENKNPMNIDFEMQSLPLNGYNLSLWVHFQIYRAQSIPK